MCVAGRDKELNISHVVFEGTTEQPGQDVADICKYGSGEQVVQEIQTRIDGVDGDWH